MVFRVFFKFCGIGVGFRVFAFTDTYVINLLKYVFLFIVLMYFMLKDVVFY